MADYTPDQITAGIAEAVKARDFPAVASLLKMLAVRDPRQAEVVYESMRAVLGYGRISDVNSDAEDRNEYLDAIVEILTIFDDDPQMTEELLSIVPGQHTAESAALVKVREIGRTVLEGRRKPARLAAWERVTLNCAHHLLTDLPDRLQIGQLATCDMCPLTTHSPGSPGLPARQVRLVVDRQPVRVSQAPASVDSVYWYTT